MIDESTGASSISICQASTFHQNDIDDDQKYTYSRFGNPTREALEDAIASLEKAKYGLAFSFISKVNLFLIIKKMYL